MYVCIKNTLDQLCLDFVLMFPVIPTIQYGPQVFNTIEGTSITLPCRASGIPTPDITWTKVCIGITGISIKYVKVQRAVASLQLCGVFLTLKTFIFSLLMAK